ncbi:unnamed protein product [Candidula unifasciata]|uniref:BTB domain-containing protein n=1 Tax=Candidula unifasciata TaxID=100452 RepID=A0A8S4A7J4_9EUPU|nr:unnamed protein product [Candidula unifasciata]
MDEKTEDSETMLTQLIISGILKGLKNQKDTCDLSDVLVVIENVEFRCHRVILAASSGFFRAAFTSGMKEDRERKVVLKGISHETFAEVMECVYTGKNVITDRNIYELWHAADMLEVLSLLEACEIFVKQKINVENCLAIYNHSKVLDSKELIPLSWSYIVKHFTFVRKCDELLMFTEEELEKLISSPDLKISSEDEVIETVLSWVAYKPTEINSGDFCHETPEPAVECKYIIQTESPDDDDTACRDNSTVHIDQEASRASEQNKDNEKYASNFSRLDHLSSLLSVVRVCLLSGKCLIEAMNTDIVRADARTHVILQKGLEYILQTDRLHDFCPPSAVHRTSSSLENVIIATRLYDDVDVLVCRRQSGQWCGLGRPVKGDYSSNSVTCFNQVVYLTGNIVQLYMYTPFLNSWLEIPKFKAVETPGYLLSIRKCLYSIFRQDGCYQIEMVNVVESFHVSSQSQWVKISTLPLDLASINYATVIDDKIIFFGTSTGELKIRVVVFDTVTLRYSTLNNIPPIASVAVCFRKENEAFMLEKDGALYRIRPCSTDPFIEIKYETRLWDFSRTVKGALVFNDELLLFGPSFSENDADKQWELSVPGVFRRIKNITCSEKLSCFMHVVIPKMYLTRAVSVISA